MSCWLNTVEDRSPPPEKKQKISPVSLQTGIMLVCRITARKRPAVLLKLTFVHTIAFISPVLQHTWNKYAHHISGAIELLRTLGSSRGPYLFTT